MRLTRMRITMAAGLLAVSGTVAATAVAVAPASAVSTTVVMVNCAWPRPGPAGRLRHRLHGQRDAGHAALADLARHRVRQRRAQGGQLHADLRPGQVHQVPGADRAVAAEGVARARRVSATSPG